MDVGIRIFWVRKVHAPKSMKIKTKMSDWSNNNRYSVTLFSLLLFLFFLLLLLLLLFTKSLCKPKNKDKRDVKKGPRWIWSWNSRLHPCGSTHSTRPSCDVRIIASLRDAQWSTDVQNEFVSLVLGFFWIFVFTLAKKVTKLWINFPSFTRKIQSYREAFVKSPGKYL